MARCGAGAPPGTSEVGCGGLASNNKRRHSGRIRPEHGFPVWLATANIMRGYMLADRGEMGAGLVLGRKGWSDWTATGSRYHGTYYLALLAQTCERADQIDEALDLVNTALEMTERLGERWFEAELLRVKGEWLSVHRRDAQQQAEDCFHRAPTVAVDQRARLWELHAAISLARHWLNQGKRTDALDLLAPLYGRFTEGFDSRDLMEPKALASWAGRIGLATS